MHFTYVFVIQNSIKSFAKPNLCVKMDKRELITLGLTVGILIFLFLCEISKLVFTTNRAGILAIKPLNISESKVLLDLFSVEPASL